MHNCSTHAMTATQTSVEYVSHFQLIKCNRFLWLYMVKATRSDCTWLIIDIRSHKLSASLYFKDPLQTFTTTHVYDICRDNEKSLNGVWRMYGVVFWNTSARCRRRLEFDAYPDVDLRCWTSFLDGRDRGWRQSAFWPAVC